jgi:hypothetical protein
MIFLAMFKLVLIFICCTAITRAQTDQSTDTIDLPCSQLPASQITKALAFDGNICYFVVDGATEMANMEKNRSEYTFSLKEAQGICKDVMNSTLVMIKKNKQEMKFVMDNFHHSDFLPKSEWPQVHGIALDIKKEKVILSVQECKVS